MQEEAAGTLRLGSVERLGAAARTRRICGHSIIIRPRRRYLVTTAIVPSTREGIGSVVAPKNLANPCRNRDTYALSRYDINTRSKVTQLWQSFRYRLRGSALADPINALGEVRLADSAGGGDAQLAASASFTNASPSVCISGYFPCEWSIAVLTATPVMRISGGICSASE